MPGNQNLAKGSDNDSKQGCIKYATIISKHFNAETCEVRFKENSYCQS